MFGPPCWGFWRRRFSPQSRPDPGQGDGDKREVRAQIRFYGDTQQNTDLLSHAVGEERALYPAVEPLLKAWGQATATMIVGHEFIRRYIEALEALAERLCTTSDVAALWEEVEAELLRLDAVLRLHLEKEERIYLPLVAQHLSESVQRSILDRMHEVSQETPDHSS